MNRHCLIWSVMALSAIGLAGCGETEEDDPVAVKELALTAQKNLEHTLRGVHGAGAFIADSPAIASSLSAFSGRECSAEAVPCAVGTVCPEPVETCEDSVTVQELAESHHELGEVIDDLLERLRERVFIEANRESGDGNSVIYRFDESLGCDPVSDASVSAPSLPASQAQNDAAPGPVTAPEPEPDTECLERAARVQPRLRLTSSGADSVTIQYLIGSARHNPLTFELSPKRAAVRLDLDALEAAIRALDGEFEGISELSGKLELELLENAARDYSARLNVLEALSVTAIGDTHPITVALGPSKPTLELRVNGNARELSGKFDYGALSVRGPLAEFSSSFEDDTAYDALGNPLPSKTYTGNLELALAGYEGALTLDGSDDQLSFTGLGFGDTTSTLKFDGATIAALDVNPNHGRHFDLTVKNDGNDRTTLGFSPTLDVSLLLNLAPLAAQIADLPSFALGDTLRFWFDGASPSLQADKDQLRVVSGTLNLSSSRVPAANLVIPAGSCLVNSGAEAPLHELLGELAVSACK